MDNRLLRLFQRQVETNCEFLLIAAQDFQIAYQEHDSGRFWFSAQNMLVAAANLSKSLWGAGGKKEAERQPLRQSLGVQDNSPLRPRKLRNHLEHFDERLDEWYQEALSSGRFWYLDRISAPAGMVAISPPPRPIEMFRHFDPQTGQLTFWGDTVSVAELVKEAQTILPIARAEAAKA